MLLRREALLPFCESLVVAGTFLINDSLDCFGNNDTGTAAPNNFIDEIVCSLKTDGHTIIGVVIKVIDRLRTLNMCANFWNDTIDAIFVWCLIQIPCK